MVIRIQSRERRLHRRRGAYSFSIGSFLITGSKIAAAAFAFLFFLAATSFFRTSNGTSSSSSSSSFDAGGVFVLSYVAPARVVLRPGFRLGLVAVGVPPPDPFEIRFRRGRGLVPLEVPVLVLVPLPAMLDARTFCASWISHGRGCALSRLSFVALESTLFAWTRMVWRDAPSGTPQRFWTHWAALCGRCAAEGWSAGRKN